MQAAVDGRRAVLIVRESACNSVIDGVEMSL